MKIRNMAHRLALCGLVAWAIVGLSGRANAQYQLGAHGGGDCYSGYHCQKHHCPPHFKHCMEGPPRLCFQRGCPKPICNPCAAPNWGYFQTCWTPWPWPPDWSHCPVQPPAAVVFPGLLVPGGPTTDVDEAPAPRKIRPGL